MSADSNSRIAWHRVQLRKNREALKALETARFTTGEIAGRRKQTSQTVADLKEKIAESERCIALHERQTSYCRKLVTAGIGKAAYRGGA